MSRGDYNGFSEADQNRGGQIQTTAYGNGALVRQWWCEACLVQGCKPGDIIPHLEDYSRPIEKVIWLCYRCHTMLHARFDHPDEWDKYRTEIASGLVFPQTRSYRQVLSEAETGRFQFRPASGPARERTVLDDIHEGLLLPEGTTEEVRARMDDLHKNGWKVYQRQAETLF